MRLVLLCAHILALLSGPFARCTLLRVLLCFEVPVVVPTLLYASSSHALTDIVSVCNGAQARFVTPFSLQKLGCNAELIVDEFGEKLLEELDYAQEARNIEVRRGHEVRIN